jgi:hypothetical protein
VVVAVVVMAALLVAITPALLELQIQAEEAVVDITNQHIRQAAQAALAS